MSLIPKWGANHFRRQMLELARPPARIPPGPGMSNHDSTRAASRYCRGEDDAQARIAMTLLLTLRGTPFMYYGEEIGMRDILISAARSWTPREKILAHLQRPRRLPLADAME